MGATCHQMRAEVEEDAGSERARKFRATKTWPFPDMRGSWSYLPLDRMAFYVHKETYRRTVRRHIHELTPR